MSSSSHSMFKIAKWRIEWLVQISVEGFLARLPSNWVTRLGELLGWALWKLMGGRRRIVIKNLRVVFAGVLSLKEIEKFAEDSFARSVANLLSAVHTAKLSDEVMMESVRVENLELLEEMTSGGRGVLLLPPHMGNWEILSRVHPLLPEGREPGGLYRPLNNPYLDARLYKKRTASNTQMFSKRDSLLVISKFLKGGGVLAILADQRAGKQGKLSNFFGRLTRSSPLPSLLIRRCKVRAMSISIRREGLGNWVLKFHPVAEVGDTQACMDAIEEAMRESLTDIFWLQDRWKCSVRGDRTFKDWLGDGEERSNLHKHRLLVWMDGCVEDWELPEGWAHADVDVELVLGEDEEIPVWAGEEAKVHRLRDVAGVKAIQQRLVEIDKSAVLPLDLVISASSSEGLEQACRREGFYFKKLIKE